MRCAATHWVYNNGITCVDALQLWTYTSQSLSVSIPALQPLETLEMGRNNRKRVQTQVPTFSKEGKSDWEDGSVGKVLAEQT